VTPGTEEDLVLLCLFARAPELGRVKRRLAAEIGPRAALEAHQRLVREALQRLTGVPGLSTELWLAGSVEVASQRWPEAGAVPLRAQCGGDLGARMHHALRDSLQRGTRALVVGTDCPSIDAAYVRGAAAVLAHADVVLGPAEDGGYGLIGAHRAVAERLEPLFRDMPWGTDRVRDTTLERCAAAGLRCIEQARVWDVDTLADWQRYLRQQGPA
jgi:rSAM/selenodomain-associated transferase 1